MPENIEAGLTRWLFCVYGVAMRIWSHILMQLELMRRIQKSRTYERYQTRGDAESYTLAEVAE